MAPKSIREYDGKRLLAKHMASFSSGKHELESRLLQITPSNFDQFKGQLGHLQLEEENPWVHSTPLVVKPDQLIKRRGKAGLLKVNCTWPEVVEWVKERISRPITVEGVTGILDNFLVEPFMPHTQEDEYYVCIQSNRQGEQFLFTHDGGINVGDVDSKALRLDVPINIEPSEEEIRTALLGNLPKPRQEAMSSFLKSMLQVYRDLHFVYMEINPIVMVSDIKVVPLDMAAKVDFDANFLCGPKWGNLVAPPPWGRPEFPEETYIRQLDAKTGASLKLTVLNPEGRVWTMVAGGGASVVYADTICDLGFSKELANYGEYSGAPDETMSKEYARTLLSLMTAKKDPRGKVLIIGGGIANFTDVAATFKGIIKALREYKNKVVENNIAIWVRRGGPNYQEGLENMRKLGFELGIPIKVYGPETHITAVVPMALGVAPVEAEFSSDGMHRSPSTASASSANGSGAPAESQTQATAQQVSLHPPGISWHQGGKELTSAETRCIVYGLQTHAIQGMLDFDHLCSRQRPSVAAIIFPFSGNHYQKFYWGTKEVLLPVYQSMAEAVEKHQDADVMINFASFRSVRDTTMECLENHADRMRLLCIIAEGVPEAQAREILKVANQKRVTIIGPATVGGIKAGAFRIGNTGGALDNIIATKLYRPGCVGYVSKSGGMSNELNNIISRNSDGVYEGVAIGGDRYPGTTFLDHLLRYQDNPDVKILVLLGEVGGVDEYDVCEAIRLDRITKPLIAWCIGTCAKMFPFEVQFGHAGALARGKAETADAKNAALKAAGAHVPANFNEFGNTLSNIYKDMVTRGQIILKPDVPEPKVPMDYNWAQKLGLVRKPAAFISSITDDRGEELLYAGMPISKVFQQDMGVGGVIGLLWFRRRLPEYASKFIEMVLMVTADHGPAVAGAHNTIVTARAGKDLISSLCAGLLTIGPRFGGALDDAAKMFSQGADQGKSAKEFVDDMKKSNQLIMGIGHRIKSVENPDMRVVIIKEYAKQHFPRTPVLDFALEIEKVTTQKKSTLILNVDGCVAACFVDLLRAIFPKEEADANIENGCLNGMFVLGRSMGFIGHFLDQKRLKQGLYRHPWDDITYMESELPE